jgi:hypothetical protein
MKTGEEESDDSDGEDIVFEDPGRRSACYNSAEDDSEGVPRADDSQFLDEREYFDADTNSNHLACEALPLPDFAAPCRARTRAAPSSDV